MAETITIVLNTQAQTAGIQATVNGLQRVKNTVASVGTSLSGFGRTLVAGLVPTLTLVGLGRMAQATLENADAMSKAAQKAGETVREFSQLAEIGRTANVSVENLTQAAKALPEWLEKSGQSGKGLSQVLIEQADIFRAMPDSLTKTALAVDMFGKSGQALIPLLNQGSDALKRQMEEADRFGLIIGPKFAANAERFNDNLSRIWGIFRGLANIVTAALLPAMNDLAESFINWVKDGDKHLAFADGLIRKFSTLASVVNVTNATVQSFFGALPAYLGALSGGAGLSEAADIARAQLKEITDAYEKRRKLIDSIKRQDDPQAPGGAQELIGTRMNDIQAQRLELEKNSLHIATVRGLVGISEYQRELLMKAELKERVELLEYAAELERQAVPETQRVIDNEETVEYAESLERANRHLREMIALKAELFNLDQDSFFERFSEGIRNITEEFDNLEAAVADVMVNGIRRSIDTVADGIWQVIDGTATWGELFQNVARNIISDLIRIAIQELFVDTLKRGIMAAWKATVSAFRAADVVQHNATEAAKTPILAANATLSSIESYGVAVAIGVAAIAAILASVGAFAEGGVVAGGEQLIRVNERGTEAVLNARATSMLGTETINALNAGNQAALAESSMPFSQSGGGNQAPINITLLLVDSMQSGLEAMESSAGQARIVQIVRNHKTEIGIG